MTTANQLASLGNSPAFSAYTSSGQTLSNSTFTKVSLNTKVFDTASAFDATTNYRFTPQVAGYYQINGAIGTVGAALGYSQISIYKNGSINTQGSGCPNNTVVGGICNVSAVIYLNGSTDYVELFAWQNSGGNLALSTATGFNTFSGSLVRAA